MFTLSFNAADSVKYFLFNRLQFSISIGWIPIVNFLNFWIVSKDVESKKGS